MSTNVNPTPAHDLWQRAASFAARAHQGQLRKDNATPYVAHPARVAITVLHVFGCDDPVCLASALLHDVIEDCDIDYDDLLEHFGAEVASCVAALSKDPRLPEPEREPAYDAQIADADWRAKLVKLADVYDNTCDRIGRLDNPDVGKLLSRCRRAVALAEPEASAHASITRAIGIVRGLIDDVESGA